MHLSCGASPMLVQFGDEDAESTISRPPPLYQQRRFWALAIPCAFTLGMLIFGIEHLIRDPNEVRPRLEARVSHQKSVSCSVRIHWS